MTTTFVGGEVTGGEVTSLSSSLVPILAVEYAPSPLAPNEFGSRFGLRAWTVKAKPEEVMEYALGACPTT